MITNHEYRQLGRLFDCQEGIDLVWWDTLYFLNLGIITVFEGKRDLTVEFDSEFEGVEGDFEWKSVHGIYWIL